MNYPRKIRRNMIRETGRKFGASPSDYLHKEWIAIRETENASKTEAKKGVI